METALPGFEGVRKFWDAQRNIYVAKVLPGEYYVTRSPEMITTVLGSCVAACIRDTQQQIGGMNHFLLPIGNAARAGIWDDTAVNASTRYGNFAMEHLINGLLRNGGSKRNLEIKLFGGASVMDMSSADVGRRNIEFVCEFLQAEGYVVSSQDLGGREPRKVLYDPLTGKAMVKKLTSETREVVASERQYLQRVVAQPVVGDIDLF